MFDKSQPLWLPRGSVRAIVALVLIVAVVVLAIAGKVEPDKLVELAGIVIAFYFMDRAAGGKPTP